ncbi:NAD(+)--rifampin ADP-ribosyltransferase [Endozoicomonas lisbonensis]|uniref:Rifampin ADP-ribosyltransferase domain-containing protein n=1 Tax=Endozoicomonas lisbonensis TaxID=3120522 RepID=A0ABV2SP71_9GAMM
MSNKVYWHGGKGGMKPGQMILPPSITGAKHMGEFGNHHHDANQVYVTTQYGAALMYASGVKKGDVYEVEPIGELRTDPDCEHHELSFSCDKARIVRRYKLSENTRKAARDILCDGFTNE